MELTNEFTVNVPVAHAWEVLTDVERIAPCMPGAQLEEIEGDEFRGSVKVKVGPITAQYKGKAHFLEKDEAGHKAVLKAEGRDTKGQGNAAAIITAQLEPAGEGTHVVVTTDLTITGRVAQFGRGVLADVSSKLLGQFVTCLETNVLAAPETVAAEIASASAASAAPAPAPAAPAAAAAEPAETAAAAPAATEAPAAPSTNGTAHAANGTAAAASGESRPTVRKIEYKAAEPVDLLETAGAPVMKRLLPLLGVGLILFLLFRRKRRA